MPADLLIVDDEPSIVAPLRFLMQQQGHTVRIVNDGADVMPAIRERCPDLVLLDVMLPSRSGYALCEDIRNEPGCRATKIILLTVKSREVDIEKGRALGADAYITKPFAIQDVVDTVAECLADT
jgi:DNA-binding response OmpR family regulator